MVAKLNDLGIGKKLWISLLVLVLPLTLSPLAFAQGGSKIEEAKAAYGLGKEILGDVDSLVSGGSNKVRHFHNRSKDVWFVRSGGIGDGSNKYIALKPGDYIPVHYNGKGGVVEIKGPSYHDIFKIGGKKFADGARLDHNGKTGRAVLNEPAGGDIFFF